MGDRSRQCCEVGAGEGCGPSGKLVGFGDRRMQRAGFQLRTEARELVSEMEPDEIMLLKCAGGWGWRTSERLGGAISGLRSSVGHLDYSRATWSH